MKRIFRGMAALAACTALFSGTLVTGSAVAAPSREGLQKALDTAVAAGAPGAYAAVIDQDGKWYGRSGTGDVANGGAPDPRGRFRAGSLTKTVVATVVLQLASEGEVGLDDRIQDHLPGLLPYTEPITVRQLLQHTSGIPATDRWNSLPEIDTTRWRHQPPSETIRLGTEGKPLAFPPGLRMVYSNTNYAVLGALVEELTGDELNSVLQRRVLDRAGMRDSALPYRYPHVHHAAARGYERLYGPDAPLTDVTDYEMSRFWGSGNLISTTDDLNRFYRALLTGRLVPAAQLAEMRTTVPSSVGGLDSGLGVMRLRLPQGCAAPEVWGFNGSVPGYNTWSMHTSDGARQITVGVTTNLTSDAARSAVFRAMLAEFCGAAAARVETVPLSA